ncbi:CK1/TTBK protein kinase [Allomyces macrogynus ATCC 38327]|uniref:non-specific serine/threonine protein kinase n=1 Tax=Allomyces macrogynus (strain ATCC 38327) TaxID=578462 RepID=A0A0L0S2L6_ALLM3|nr:CK1/TTBK protein kinase, variant [Allomyces macrogynus ATCC 38327]KNE56784.1 CK1/TTBK protein kinase [Allomyces macrogynus ATCC 38327]|eukprot:KNE56783.1 CK1/TTBK protein kinase, variant [Allomyces macrogynus ATCC 38327]
MLAVVSSKSAAAARAASSPLPPTPMSPATAVDPVDLLTAAAASAKARRFAVASSTHHAAACVPTSPRSRTTPAMAPATSPAQSVVEIGAVIQGKWRVLGKLGQGAFGQTLEAEDLATGHRVGIKFEMGTAVKPVLKLEVSILRRMHGCLYASHLYGHGVLPVPVESAAPTDTAPQMFMVMSLHGANLSDLRKRQPDHRFSLSTTALLGRQMIASLRELHHAGYLHRDVKPSNFVMGLDRHVPDARGFRRARCYVIDFGLARRYLTADGHVRDARATAGFRGTARYASLAAHESRELARRDDLWSVLYLLVEALTGSLPWRREKDRDAVYAIKKVASGPGLVADLPVPLRQFHAHLVQLQYADEPDYEYLMALMDQCLILAGEGPAVPYDWERPAHIPKPPMPMCHPAPVAVAAPTLARPAAESVGIALAQAAVAATPACEPFPGTTQHQQPSTPAATPVLDRTVVAAHSPRSVLGTFVGGGLSASAAAAAGPDTNATVRRRFSLRSKSPARQHALGSTTVVAHGKNAEAGHKKSASVLARLQRNVKDWHARLVKPSEGPKAPAVAPPRLRPAKFRRFRRASASAVSDPHVLDAENELAACAETATTSTTVPSLARRLFVMHVHDQA